MWYGELGHKQFALFSGYLYRTNRLRKGGFFFILFFYFKPVYRLYLVTRVGVKYRFVQINIAAREGELDGFRMVVIG